MVYSFPAAPSGTGSQRRDGVAGNLRERFLGRRQRVDAGPPSRPFLRKSPFTVRDLAITVCYGVRSPATRVVSGH